MAARESALAIQLEKVLLELLANPCPYVANPPNAPQKRASVALILRVRPSSGPQKETVFTDVSTFKAQAEAIREVFSEQWVRQSDPEILFIKRAGRAGDRWSGHVALPGGKRDEADDSDLAAAIRETEEEVGLDLRRTAIYGGKLPERIVTTAWGSQILMVLCPFVFLLTNPDHITIQLQPTEVASAHWVPLRFLLSPQLRTREAVDVSERMSRNRGLPVKWLLRYMLGPMTFSAIQLIPSESSYCLEAETPARTLKRRLQDIFNGYRSMPSRDQPILLWGLTLGVLADFLDMFPPYNAVELWTYPTFTTPDLRLLLWIISHPLRKSNYRRALANDRAPNLTAVDATTAAMPAFTESQESQEAGLSGLGVGRHNHTQLVGNMLRGYFLRVHYAIALWLLVRGVAACTVLTYLWKKSRRKT